MQVLYLGATNNFTVVEPLPEFVIVSATGRTVIDVKGGDVRSGMTSD